MEATIRDSAIDRAYRDHAPDVYRVAYGVLRDTDEAIDATQDTFARAWERWDQYDSQRPLRAWLHGIVVNLALDRLRRRRVRRLALPALGDAVQRGAMASRSIDPAEDVARRLLVDEALASLPGRTRAVLVLRHYYGYEYAQIGAFLGLNSGTVGSTLSRAHAELRGRIERDDSPKRTPEPGAGRASIHRTGTFQGSATPGSEPPEVPR